MIINKKLLNGEKRNSLDIERDVLEYLILKPQGERHTNLLFKCNLSYIQSCRYFDKMKRAGFIYVSGRGFSVSPLYKTLRSAQKGSFLRITKKGIDRYIQLRLLNGRFYEYGYLSFVR